MLATGVLESAGPVMVWVIVLGFVFTECAFIVGLFLPGDSLLFAAGVVLAQHDDEWHAWALSIAAMVTAVVGNLVGYYIGHKTGHAIITRRGGRVLNHRQPRQSTGLPRPARVLGHRAGPLDPVDPHVRPADRGRRQDGPQEVPARHHDRRAGLGADARAARLLRRRPDQRHPVAQGRRALGQHRVLRVRHRLRRRPLPPGDAPAAGKPPAGQLPSERGPNVRHSVSRAPRAPVGCRPGRAARSPRCPGPCAPR